MGRLALPYGAMTLAFRSGRWFARPRLGWVAVLAALGALVAIAVELHALSSGRWSYAPAMPRLPLLEVGWVPVLQMIAIPFALACASRRWGGAGGRA